MSELIKAFIDIFLHLDKNLTLVISEYGTLSYAFLFFIIFMETGFVVTPFLPGDSLLFAAGAISATSSLDIGLVYLLLTSAAIVGDTVNYWVGHFIGPKIFIKDTRFIKRQHLIRTQKFYDKYGWQAIILARFVPILRTFAPFVAGIAKMSYKHFILYNVVGGILWVSIFLFGGYFFGNLSFVKDNFHLTIIAIILISVAPIIVELLRAKRRLKKN